MKLFSSGKSKNYFTPATQPLPLGALSRATDSITGERGPDPNPDLPALLARFVYYLDNIPIKSALYSNTLSRWLLGLVETPATPVVENSGGQLSYRLAPSIVSADNPAEALRLRIKGDLAAGGDTSLYAYIGLFLFTCWYFLVDSADGVYFSDRVKRFCATRCLAWPEVKSKTTGISINERYITGISVSDTSGYSPTFLNGMKVSGTSLLNMTDYACLGNDEDSNNGIDKWKLFKISSTKMTSLSNRSQASFDFIKFFREMLSNIVKEEFRDLIKTLSIDANNKLKIFDFFAVGNGSDTNGLFNAHPNLGTAFFNYEGELSPKNARPHYQPKLLRDVPLLTEEEARKAPVVFLAQWGLDQAGSQAAVTICGVPDVANVLTATSPIQNYLSSVNSPEFSYDGSTGLLSLRRDPNAEVGLRLTSDRIDEVVFFIMSYTPVDGPVISPNPRLHVDYRFQDNVFTIPASVSSGTSGFWSSLPDVDALRTFIEKMRDDPDFTITASISGQGVGEGVDAFTSVPQSKLVSAEDQSDNELDNTSHPDNATKRYAYGEVIWKSGPGGHGGVLDLCTEGFASGLRCTFESWPAFQVFVPALGMTKAQALSDEIGQFLRTSSNLPAHADKASYNTTLSAFRAFGMMEAIVNRLIDYACSLPLTDLTADQCNAIVAKLNDYLNNQARCQLLQVGLDRMTNITIDYTMFQKYAY